MAKSKALDQSKLDGDVQEALNLLRVRWPEFRDNPDLLVSSGLFQIYSDCYIDENGIEHRVEGKDIKMVFRPSLFQRHLRSAKKYCIGRGQPCVADILKGRRAKATTGIFASFISQCITNDGIRAAVFAPTQDQAENIFQQAHALWSNLSIIPGAIIETKYDRKDALGFYSDIIEFATRDSFFRAYGATKECVDAARGDGVSLVSVTEADYVDDLEALSAPLGTSLLKNRFAEFWCETTVNRKDGEFAERYLPKWIAQNRKNPWEDGFNHHGFGSRLSIFSPAYADPNNRKPLYNFMGEKRTKEDLIADLDAYEKSWYPRIMEYALKVLTEMLPYGMAMSKSDRILEAQMWAVEYLNFRRACLRDCAYPNWPNDGSGIPAGGYRKMERYYAEYPHEPEEAFMGSKTSVVVSPETKAWCEKQVREPIVDGQLVGGGEGRPFRFDNSTAGEIDSFRLYKYPWECAGPIGMSIDPHPGATGLEINRDQKYDHTWIVFRDWATGDQIAEYVTQERDARWYREAWKLMQFMGSNERGDLNSDRMPYVSEEAFNGAPFLNHLLEFLRYDPSRIFMDRNEETLEANFSNKIGWYARGASKRNAVQALVEQLETAMELDLCHDEKRREALLRLPRFTPRSKYIVEQMGYFIEKISKDGTKRSLEAVNKGRNKPDSCDDGISASYVDAWQYRQHVIQYGVPGIAPEAEVEEPKRDEFSRPSTEELVGMEIDAVFDRYNGTEQLPVDRGPESTIPVLELSWEYPKFD